MPGAQAVPVRDRAGNNISCRFMEVVQQEQIKSRLFRKSFLKGVVKKYRESGLLPIIDIIRPDGIV